jgi:hypothetical protein
MRTLLLVLSLLTPLSLCAQAQADSAAIRKLLADSSAFGLPIGTLVPAFELKDQNGHIQNLRSLSGSKGLILVFFRSADW